MVEVQNHGFTFEKWVRDTFFDGYSGGYADDWDIPAHISKTSTKIPNHLQGLPFSVKIAKYRSSIGLGDILRQRSITQPFVMIIGFWIQDSPTSKRIVAILALHIQPDDWEALWSGLKLDEIQAIDNIIKNRTLSVEDARKKAECWKKKALSKYRGCQITPNRKIDSKQRRIQCSLRFKLAWNLAKQIPSQHKVASLFGLPFQQLIASSSRTFNSKKWM